MAIQINGKASPEIYSIYPTQYSMKAVSLLVTKLPVAKGKKGDTKIINPVLRNSTLF